MEETKVILSPILAPQHEAPNIRINQVGGNVQGQLLYDYFHKEKVNSFSLVQPLNPILAAIPTLLPLHFRGRHFLDGDIVDVVPRLKTNWVG